MIFGKITLAGLVLSASLGANADVVGSTGGSYGPLLTLAGPGTPNSGGTLSGSASATIIGGSVLLASQTFANDVVPGSAYLATGPVFGSPASLEFDGGGVDYISFLWGSPELFNSLTVYSTGAAQIFTPFTLGFSSSNYDENGNQAVQFSALNGGKITSVVFSSTDNALEVGNFSINQVPVTAVPEPATLALMLAGLGAVGLIARRNRTSSATRSSFNS